MFVTIVISAVANAQTETSQEIRPHLCLTFHLPARVPLDALREQLEGVGIDRHSGLEHHAVYLVMLPIDVSVHIDDHAQFVLAVVLQQQTEKTGVEGGGFWVKS